MTWDDRDNALLTALICSPTIIRELLALTINVVEQMIDFMTCIEARMIQYLQSVNDKTTSHQSCENDEATNESQGCALGPEVCLCNL
jgi:hypothetical protein